MTTIQSEPPVIVPTRETRTPENENGAVIIQCNTRIVENKRVSPDVVLPSAPVLVPQYPVWPTSQPGPTVIAPPFGQHPHPVRTDQMVYEHYDQEHGRAYIPAAIKPAVAAHRGKVYRPDVDKQDVFSETDAAQRWLDDGGRLHD